MVYSSPVRIREGTKCICIYVYPLATTGSLCIGACCVSVFP